MLRGTSIIIVIIIIVGAAAAAADWRCFEQRLQFRVLCVWSREKRSRKINWPVHSIGGQRTDGWTHLVFRHLVQIVGQLVAGRWGDAGQRGKVHLHLLDHVVHRIDALVPGTTTCTAASVVYQILKVN